MTAPWRVAVVLELETDDARLSPERFKAGAHDTAEGVAATRQAVLENLDKTARVVMVTGPELIQLIFETQEMAQQIIRDAGYPLPEMINKPPASYVSPDDVWRRRKGKKH